MAPSFPVSELPAELREQLRSLRQGEEISLVEDGKVVGSVSAPRVLVGQVVPVAAEAAPPPPSRAGVRFVATGMKLTEEVRPFLSTALGEEYAVVDIRTAPETIDALLVPPLSAHAYLAPGTLGDLASEVRLVVEGRTGRALSSGEHRGGTGPAAELGD